MTFGIEPPEPKKLWWGARAIFEREYDRRRGEYRRAYIDIVWDRQQVVDGTEEERKKLLDWVNNFGLPALRKLVNKKPMLFQDEQRLLTVERDGYHLEADPKASHGYLYIGAWPVGTQAVVEKADA